MKVFETSKYSFHPIARKLIEKVGNPLVTFPILQLMAAWAGSRTVAAKILMDVCTIVQVGSPVDEAKTHRDLK
jgi:hypothetical protein